MNNFREVNSSKIEQLESIEILNLDYAIENYDTPLDVTLVCYPNHPNPRELMSYFARRVYSTYVQNVNKFSLIEARELAIKKSHYSGLELDIKIKTLIEHTFRTEIEEMYSISWDIIEFTEPSKIHQLIKDFNLVENAYVTTKPEQLSDSTLYKNQRYSENNLRVNTNSMYSL
jgi:hypothetical protein